MDLNYLIFLTKLSAQDTKMKFNFFLRLSVDVTLFDILLFFVFSEEVPTFRLTKCYKFSRALIVSEVRQKLDILSTQRKICYNLHCHA